METKNNTETDARERDWKHRLVSYVLGARQTKGTRKKLMLGAQGQRNGAAMPLVFRFTTHRWQELPALRSAAIIAESRDLPLATKTKDGHVLSLAASIADVARALDRANGVKFDPEKVDSFGRVINQAPLWNMEDAARQIGGLLDRGRRTKVGVNYFDLVKLLAAWDYGSPVEKRERRSRFMQDYYRRRVSFIAENEDAE